MLRTLIIKEFKNILQSPMFLTTFLTSFILILLSIIVGILEYKTNISQYHAGLNLSNQELQERTSWMGSGATAYRLPDPMQIFISGVNNDIGRLSDISFYSDVKLQNSYYSDDPVFAVFRFLDLSFIVQIVLSLIAVLFTYDAISGERETGTLKFVFSNSVSKIRYIVVKWFGSWLGLLVPVLIPLLVGLLLVLFYNIPLNSTHWLKLFSFFLISLAYFTFFITLGLLISSLTRQSSTSFLILLVCWICFVLIIPRIGTMTASQFVSVPGVAEIEAQRSAVENDIWEKHEKQMAETWRIRNTATQNMTKEEREQYQDENMWEWMQQDDAARKEVQKEIGEISRKMNEDLQNRKIQQEKLGFLLSRFSPSSCYQLAAMNIAETDIGLKHRYVQAMENYKTQFTSFVDKKQKESGQPEGLQIMIDSERGLSVKTPDMKKTIDISEMPQFQQPVQPFYKILEASVIDFGLLLMYCLLSFVLSVYFFLKYDVR
jgi:ABC-type transport system involved in multi-copper enzyme maturation permease subunit